MSNNPRLTQTTFKVLRMFLDRPTKGIAGSDIWKETRILSGSLYPALARLEKAGWLESWWEDIDPKEVGRPRRRLYKLTALGQREVRAAFLELMPAGGQIAWSF